MALATEKKQEIIEEYQRSPDDTGSTEVQVALLTERIRQLTEHCKEYQKDHSTRLGLLKLVSRRTKLLQYLSDKDHDRYKTLIESLGLRK